METYVVLMYDVVGVEKVVYGRTGAVDTYMTNMTRDIHSTI